MTDGNEAFLDRWSRLKRNQAQPAQAEAPARAQPDAKDAPPVLPPVEELKPDSDFTPFMNPRVDAGTRRSALKKLFAGAQFNVPDPFEAYSEDYTGGESIPADMLRAINRARDVAVKGEDKVLEEERLAKQAQEEARTRADAEARADTQQECAASPREATDGAGRQDT